MNLSSEHSGNGCDTRYESSHRASFRGGIVLHASSSSLGIMMTRIHLTSLGAFYDLELANRHDDTMDYACWYEAYFRGYRPPNYQVPAIPLAVKYDYPGCVNIDNVSDPDDPFIVWFYNSWE
jgi:hypothetical protein